jgi:hypothetical protein
MAEYRICAIFLVLYVIFRVGWGLTCSLCARAPGDSCLRLELSHTHTHTHAHPHPPLSHTVPDALFVRSHLRNRRRVRERQWGWEPAPSQSSSALLTWLRGSLNTYTNSPRTVFRCPRRFGVLILVLVSHVGKTPTGSGPWDWSVGGFSTLAFLVGGTTSIISGYIGMKVAVFSNARTTVSAIPDGAAG